MELRCEDVVSGLGCDYVATGETAADVKAAMMAHGGTVHANLLEGKSPEELEAAKSEMDHHISELIAALN